MPPYFLLLFLLIVLSFSRTLLVFIFYIACVASFFSYQVANEGGKGVLIDFFYFFRPFWGHCNLFWAFK